MSQNSVAEKLGQNRAQGYATLMRSQIERQGYLTLRGILTVSALREIHSVIDHQVQAPTLVSKRFLRVQWDPADSRHSLQLELPHLALISRSVRRSEVLATCRHLATQILGVRSHYLFDHAIYKMPGNRMSTPWHQDQAYLGANVNIRSVHFWIPFQDMCEENGTLCFANQKLDGLLPHEPVGPSGSQLLRMSVEPGGPFHVLQTSVGDISIHTNLTLHAAGENRSDHTRKVWVVHFGDRPAWYKYWRQFCSRFT